MSTWRVLWQLLSYRPHLYLGTALGWAWIHTIPIWMGLILKAFFDRLVPGVELGWDLWKLLVLFYLVAGGSILMGAAWFAHTFEQNMTALLRRNVVAWLFAGPGTPRLPGAPGEALSRLRDDAGEVTGYAWSWGDLWGGLLYVVLGLGVMAAISPTVTLVVVLPMVGVVVATQRLGPRLRRYRQASRDRAGRVAELVAELFAGVLAVQVGGAEARTADRLAELSEARRRAALRDRLFGELLRVVGDNLHYVAIGVVLLLSARSMREGSFTVGDFALFSAYLPRMGQLVQYVSGLSGAHKRVTVSTDRLRELADGAPAAELLKHAPAHLSGELPAVPSIVRSPADRLERLEVRGLSSGVVRDVSFVVERGQLVVVAGRLGAGKSTLLRALLGLARRDGGAVLWNGQAVASLAPPRAAYVPQVPRLFSETLRENVHLGQPGDLGAALRMAVLDGEVPPETLVGPRGVKLSGGQLQRAAAARALVVEPELLVVDDLSSALDAETEQALWRNLAGRTVLAVSNRPAAWRAASRIVVLDDGRVEATGALDELVRESAAMERLWSAAIGAQPVEQTPGS